MLFTLALAILGYSFLGNIPINEATGFLKKILLRPIFYATIAGIVSWLLIAGFLTHSMGSSFANAIGLGAFLFLFSAAQRIKSRMSRISIKREEPITLDGGLKGHDYFLVLISLLFIYGTFFDQTKQIPTPQQIDKVNVQENLGGLISEEKYKSIIKEVNSCVEYNSHSRISAKNCVYSLAQKLSNEYPNDYLYELIFAYAHHIEGDYHNASLWLLLYETSMGKSPYHGIYYELKEKITSAQNLSR